MKFLEDLPPWVPVVFIAIVLALLMLRSGGTSADAGATRFYTPTPADPNVIGEMAVESNNRLAAFQSVTDVMGAEEISRITSARDTAIAGITADSVNRQTDAAVKVSTYQSETSRLLGLAQTDADLHASLEQTHAASSLGLQSIAAEVEKTRLTTAAETQQVSLTTSAAERTAKTQAGAAVTTAKVQSKGNSFNNVVSTIGNVASGLLHLFF